MRRKLASNGDNSVEKLRSEIDGAVFIEKLSSRKQVNLLL